LEIRRGDAVTAAALAPLNDLEAFICVEAERSFLRELGAGCSIPAGAHARWVGGTLTLSGVMLGVDGSSSVRHELQGVDPLVLGASLAAILRDHLGGASLEGWRP